MSITNLEPGTLYIDLGSRPTASWSLVESISGSMLRGFMRNQETATGFMVGHSSPFDLLWIKVASPVRLVTFYESEDAMRYGPRFYSSAQMQIIREAVEERSPLPEPPLPLDD